MDNSIEYFSSFDATKIKQQLQKQTESVITDRFLNAVAKLEQSSPIGASVTIGEQDLKSGWELDIQGFQAGEFVVQVINKANHSLNRLEGRKSGKQPPIDAIVPWVQFKLKIGDPRQIRQIAFLIARKIGKYGTDRSKRNFKEFDPQTGEFAPNGAVAIAIKQIERDLTNIQIG